MYIYYTQISYNVSWTKLVFKKGFGGYPPNKECLIEDVMVKRNAI